MADVLSQNEVDALLQAVGGDDVGGLVSAPAAAPTKSARPAFQDKNYNVYDFKRPNRVSSEQMRALSSLHENFARNLGAELTGVLRTVIDIQASQAEQLTYQEFIMSLPNPTSIATLACDPMSGEMVLELNPTICFPIIDKMLGGGHSSSNVPERPFSEIEMRLIAQIFEHIIHNLQDVWSPIADLRFSVSEMETNPQIMQSVAPNESVVLLTFEVRMSEGEAGGMLNLCIPFNVIEPIMGSLSSQSWCVDRSKMGPEDSIRLRKNVQDVHLPLEVFIAETSITAHDLACLKPGDVISTPKLHDRPLILNIAGKPKFRTTMGQIRSHKAVRIDSAASETEHLNV
ncbi:MAG: flagellar motor switch protein FliM [Planctomycetes bacterium]|nr:flagellar motor switch protein FliM [Planctomycetota bacterium]